MHRAAFCVLSSTLAGGGEGKERGRGIRERERREGEERGERAKERGERARAPAASLPS